MNRFCKNKILLLIFLVSSSVFLSGCNKNKPVLLFNSNPITKQTVGNYSNVFESGQKIYYVILNKKGFKNDIIRIQVVKKEEKAESWGYAINYSKDVKVDQSKNYYIDYFVINREGSYFMQAFYLDNFDTAFVRNPFTVKEPSY